MASGRGGRRTGTVIETRGRRVLVAPEQGGEGVVCFLAGQRAVVGDLVEYVEPKGGGGKLVGVLPRRSRLLRVAHNGREQLIAANLAGIFVVCTPGDPPFRPGLLDRYLVAASAQGLRACAVLNKTDLGVPDEVEAALRVRVDAGVALLRVSAARSEGLDALRAHVATHDDGPWALVGHSGVGKTSLVAALLPTDDVGPVGALSTYWGTGQHTTTGSRCFALPGGGELVDSPGIRTFTPGGITTETVRAHFPGIPVGRCRYRDCQHREGEDGCAVEGAVEPELLASYRRLLEDVRGIEEGRRR